MRQLRKAELKDTCLELKVHVLAFIVTHLSISVREVKQQRRRRRGQGERHKTVGLMGESNASARAFYILVQLFAVPYKTTTSNDQFIGFVENVNTITTVNFLFSI